MNAKSLLSVWFPIFLSHLVYTFQGLFLIYIVSPFGKDAIAGVGFSTIILWLIYAVGEIAYAGVSILTARAVGRKIHAGNIVLNGIILSVAISLLVALASKFFVPFLSHVVSQKTLFVIEDFLKPVMFFLPLMLTANTFNASFSACGKTNFVFLMTVFANVVMLVLALVFVKQFDFGVEGAGLSLALSESCSAIVYLLFALKEKALNPFKSPKFSLLLLRSILKLGMPVGLEEIIISASYNVFTGLVASCGTESLAGFQIGLKIEAVSVSAGIGLLLATTILTSQISASGKRTSDFLITAVKTGSLTMTFFGIVMVVLSGYLPRFFSSNGNVIESAKCYLILAGISQLPMAVSFVVSGYLRGLKKTFLPLVVNVGSFWFLRLLPCFLLPKNACYLWGAMLFETAVRGLIFLGIVKNELNKKF